MVRPYVLETLGHNVGFTVLGGVLFLAAAGFGLAMYRLLDRAHRSLLRRNQELAEANAVNDSIAGLLLRVARSMPLDGTLDSLVGNARELLEADAAALRLDPHRGVGSGQSALHRCGRTDGLLCVAAAGITAALPDAPRCRPGDKWRDELSFPIASAEGPVGELWVGRRTGAAFDDADRGVGNTLAGLVTVALDQSRMIEAEARGAALAERERIARELHDSLAQVLGVIQLRLTAAVGRAELADCARTRTELNELTDLAREAYRDVREAILGLKDSSRTDRSLVEHLDDYVRAFSRTSRIPTALEADPDAAEHLSPAATVQVIRVIQEALTNVRKHSGARCARVTVSRDAGRTLFVVEDDGTGFDPDSLAADRDGFGLHAMRERTESVNGHLTIESRVGEGTRIVVALPAHHQVPARDAEELSA